MEKSKIFCKSFLAFIFAELILIVYSMGSTSWLVFDNSKEGLFRSCSFSVCASYTGNIGGGFAAFFLVFALVGILASGYFYVLEIYQDCEVELRLLSYTNGIASILHFMAIFCYICGNGRFFRNFSIGFYICLVNFFLITSVTMATWKFQTGDEPPLSEYREQWADVKQWMTRQKDNLYNRMLPLIPRR